MNDAPIVGAGSCQKHKAFLLYYLTNRCSMKGSARWYFSFYPDNYTNILTAKANACCFLLCLKFSLALFEVSKSRLQIPSFVKQEKNSSSLVYRQYSTGQNGQSINLTCLEIRKKINENKKRS